MFEVGKLYNRKRDLHERFGGQRQHGISTPSDQDFIMLFTGESGQSYGYHDGWGENGVFRYCGEGKIGDMLFQKGNKAIRDHAANGKTLHLFQALGKSKPVRYLGEFACASYEYSRGDDEEGNDRKTIFFHLVQSSAEHSAQVVSLEAAEPAAEDVDLKSLRKAAIQAATQQPQETKSSSSPGNYYARARDVRKYVLARAKGKCEACFSDAPFQRKNGTPYLEAHHTKLISEGGPDHPKWVGAICPNCHREIHSGIAGKDLNARLSENIERIEAESLK